MSEPEIKNIIDDADQYHLTEDEDVLCAERLSDENMLSSFKLSRHEDTPAGLKQKFSMMN
jgi:hypothetical protein